MSFFFLSTIAFSVISQSILDLSITLLMLSLIFYHYIKHKTSPKIAIIRKPFLFEIGFILYIFSIVLGLIYYYQFDFKTIIQSVIKFSWIINFYIFYWYFKTTRPKFKTIVLFFICGFLISNIYALTTFIYNYDFLTQDELKNRRVIGLLNSATYHAHANALIFSFFVTYIFFKFKELSFKLKVAFLAATTLMGLSIFLTLTRGPILSLFIVFMIFIFMQSRKWFILALATIMTISLLLYTQTDLIKNRVAQTVDKSQIDNIRVNLFKVHIEMIKDSPLIGIGYNSPLNHTRGWWHTLNLPEDYYDSHAHNQLLNVWATTGIFGLLSFCLFYFWFLIKNLQLVRFFKQHGDRENYYLATACLITQAEYLLANLTDIGFEYSKIRTLILIIWALVLALMTKQKEISHAIK